MAEIIVNVCSDGFLQLFIKVCVAGVGVGFGAEVVLSLMGSALYKFFNYLERSAN